MIDGEITLLAAVVAGLASSGHCVAMCGGMAGLLAARQHRAKPVRQTLAYNFGRIASYTIAGLVVGILGHLLVLGSGLQTVAGHLRLVAGIIIVIAGLTLLFGNRLFRPFEGIGAAFWKRVSPLAVSSLSRNSDRTGNAIWLGMLWGWLPCGMTYAMLATAAVTADPLHAASLMAAFGLGTLPAMAGVGLVGMKLRERLRGSGFKRFAGVLLVIAGVWTAQPMKFIAAMQDSPPAAHEHRMHEH